jgi:hypothetical protein
MRIRRDSFVGIKTDDFDSMTADTTSGSSRQASPGLR